MSAPSAQASQSQYFSPLALSSAACSANCGTCASSSTVATFSSRAATYALVAAALASRSLTVSRYFCAAALRSAFVHSTAIRALVFSIRLSRMAFWPRYIPKPCSALSSNRELHHAGPLPSAFVQYGLVAPGLPQMEEQPVALEIYILSPNSWVTRRA